MTARLPKTGFTIEPYRDQIVATVRESQITVISAEPAAGKTSLVPPMLYDAGFSRNGRIAVALPTRPATTLIANFVSGLYGTPVGDLVGYQIGGAKQVSDETRIVYETNGILLRHLHSDRYLRRYGVVIVDEAHERKVEQDLILALLKRLAKERPSIKIVVMSATINEEMFSDFFGKAPIIKIPGRVFPVNVEYENETPIGTNDLLKVALERSIAALKKCKGNILGFLPEEAMIRKLCDQIEDRLKERGISNVDVWPLYGSQSSDEQNKALEKRDGRRKIIWATNVAETSITIEGTDYVIDSGLIKAHVHVGSSMSALKVGDHSQSGCTQRAGRAGRTGPGRCLRLYTETDFVKRPKYSEPEIKCMSLDETLLQLRCLDYSMDEVLGLEFPDPPSESRWHEAEDQLKILNALDRDGNVTNDGRRMEKLPLSPIFGRMLLTAEKSGCLKEVAKTVAGFSGRQIFFVPKEKEQRAVANDAQARFKNPSSDALTILNIWEEWEESGENGERAQWARDNFLSSRALREIERNYEQIIKMLEEEGFAITSSTDPVAIRKAVAAGLITNLCTQPYNHSYSWRGQSGIYVFPGSSVFGHDEDPPMIVCSEVVETTKRFARNCTVIDPSWLEELIPESALKRKYEFRDLYLDGSFQIIEKLNFHGTVIRENIAHILTDEILPFVALRLAEEMLEHHFRHIHPQSRVNQTTWRIIKNALEKEFFGFLITFDDETASEEVKKTALRLITFFQERIKGIQNLEELKSRDIALVLEEWVPAEALEKYREEIEREKEIEEVRRREEENRRERYARAREEEKGVKDALRASISDLKARLQNLSGHETENQRIELVNIDYRLIYESFDRITAEISVVEGAIKRLEREQSSKIELAEQAWKLTLELAPSCPLCNGPWQMTVQKTLVCNGSHNRSQLISVGPALFVTTIGHFVSDREEEVAEMYIGRSEEIGLRFEMAREYAWNGKKFKKVNFHPQAAVLPAELLRERDSILRDLGELRRAQEELRAIDQRLKEAKACVGAGAMKKLTFKIIGGITVAEDNGVTYQAAYTENYPAEKETWFCRIGRDLSNSGRRTVEVYPEFKAGSISSSSDIEELCQLLKESYPGLPATLLLPH